MTPDNCKFCGSGDVKIAEYDILTNGDSYHYWFAQCLNCGAGIENQLSYESALAAWNRKPEPEPITPEGLERLGFVLTFEYLTKHYNLKNKQKTIHIIFNGYENAEVCIGVGKLPYIIIEYAKTMKDITNLMRVFLGCNI